jgi:hypothetical protein
LADEARRGRLCDWAVREILTTTDPVIQQRATFVAGQLNCTLVVDSRLETLVHGGTPQRAVDRVGRIEAPWFISGLLNLVVMLPGAAMAFGIFWGVSAVLRRRAKSRGEG